MINISLALVPVLHEVDPLRIGIIENGDKNLLLEEPINKNISASDQIITIVKEHIPVDIRRLSIIPIGFFDSFIFEEDIDNRRIILAYKVIMYPETPISTKIRFKKYDELGEGTERCSPDHLRIARAAIHS